jgi:hypothetical protein
MKETSKEARPHEGDIDNQLFEVIRCLANQGPLTRRQISEETDIQYSSITWRINDHFLGKEGVTEPLFKVVGTVVIPVENPKTGKFRNIRYELIDLINKQEELKTSEKIKYDGNTTLCDRCNAEVRAKDSGKPQWREDGYKEDGSKKWRMIDLDNQTHDCNRSQVTRDTQLLDARKRRAVGVPEPSPRLELTSEEIENFTPKMTTMELDRKGAGHILEKLGATLVKLSLWEEKKVWGGSKETGYTQTYNMGAEFAFDKNLDIDPDEALEQASDYITRHINKKLGIKQKLIR